MFCIFVHDNLWFCWTGIIQIKKKNKREKHVGTQVQTGTPEVLATAVAAPLPDLGCRRRSISFSACPQLQYTKTLIIQNKIPIVNITRQAPYNETDLRLNQLDQTRSFNLIQYTLCLLKQIIYKLTYTTYFQSLNNVCIFYSFYLCIVFSFFLFLIIR